MPPLFDLPFSTDMTLYVFNPEHDLCLANGDANYLPPASALSFARRGGNAMRILYGDAVDVIAADDYAQWQRWHELPDAVVPWGWDLRLKRTLLRQSMPSRLLLSDDVLADIRRLQHRATLLPLQPHARCLSNADAVRELLAERGELLLKAPWSGAGWGLRHVSGTLTSHDEGWLARMLALQGAVIVETFFADKGDDFAIEFLLHDGKACPVGLSLFRVRNGRYQCNELLYDDDIRRRLSLPDTLVERLAGWLDEYVAPHYEGFMGIDLFVADGTFVVAEMNLRHTMGWVAHRFLEQHPEQRGKLWSPDLI